MKQPLSRHNSEMANLLQLPTESLQQIINYVIPNEFDALRLTCKTINAACDHFVPQHREFVRHFRNWSARKSAKRGRDVTDPTSEGLDPSIELLIEIARHPVAARYIRGLDLRPIEIDEPQSSLIKDGDDLRLVEELIRQSSFLHQADDNPQRWLDYLQMDKEQEYGLDKRTLFCTVFLLTLLPNLHSLGLSDHWPRRMEDEKLSSLLDNLISRANAAAEDDTTALRTLTVLTPFTEFGYDCKMPLQSVEPFLALRSLRECHGASYIALEDGYTGESFTPTLQPLGTNLTTLELWECVFGRHEMKALVADMHQLKRLCISLTTKWHGCGFDCNAGGVVGSIAESPAAKTLTHLTLLCTSPWNQCFTGVDSLKAFQALKDLVIDAAYFLGPPYSLHRDFDDAAEMYAKNGHPTDQATPRLDLILPASLASFGLLVGYPLDHIKTLSGMLKGLDSDTLQAATPTLDKITFRVLKTEFNELDKSVDPWPMIQSTATDIGADWELFDQQGGGYWETEELTDFMERFDVEST